MPDGLRERPVPPGLGKLARNSRRKGGLERGVSTWGEKQEELGSKVIYMSVKILMLTLLDVILTQSLRKASIMSDRTHGRGSEASRSTSQELHWGRR